MRLLNTADIFCNNNSCNSISENGNILYSDRHHLSYFGANLLMNEIISNIF